MQEHVGRRFPVVSCSWWRFVKCGLRVQSLTHETSPSGHTWQSKMALVTCFDETRKIVATSMLDIAQVRLVFVTKWFVWVINNLEEISAMAHPPRCTLSRLPSRVHLVRVAHNYPSASRFRSTLQNRNTALETIHFKRPDVISSGDQR